MRIRVVSQGSDPRIFHVGDGERLLYAGLAQGVLLPYECGTGTCGQCRAVLEEGTVADLWPEAPGHKFKRRDRNEILMCQTHACSDCVLHLPSATVASLANFQPPSEFNGLILGAETLSPDVLRLRIRVGRPFKSLPGQFVLLEADLIDGPRAYSLTTSERTTEFDLLIRRKVGGILTEWLFSKECIGQSIKLFGPLGRSVFQMESDKDLLLAAGGTGVASTVAILRAAIKVAHLEFHTATVFFGVRTPEDLFYLDELQALTEAAPKEALKINICFSHASPPSTAAPSGLHFRNGFVHEIVKQDLPTVNLAETTALLSGPPPMIDAMLTTLIKAKFPARNIRYDKFS